MKQSRDDRLAERIAGMRTPLSRVELAAAQLARRAETPAAATLAAEISDAVSNLDDRISEALHVLSAVVPSRGGRADCREVLDALRARMAPVLRARGVEWNVEQASDAAAVLGDPDDCADGALALLAAGMDLAGTGGRISLSVEAAAPAGCCVSLRATRASAKDTLAHTEAQRILGRVREQAALRGARLEVADASDLAMTLWLSPGREASCDA